MDFAGPSLKIYIEMYSIQNKKITKSFCSIVNQTSGGFLGHQVVTKDKVLISENIMSQFMFLLP